jgi:eukaryotic-like serine/threonine-protein kinase
VDVPTGPAYCLDGMTLDDGWTVVKRLELPPDSTGGTFSIGYVVSDAKGRVAFLKALDFSRVFGRTDTMQIIKNLVDGYDFEQQLSYLCKDRRMSRVVHPLGHGMVTVDGMGFAVPDVYYIIYEMADGDSRQALSLLGQGAVTWKLRTLHGVATGIRQLHSAGVAHQDVKPSNVMCFEIEGAKLGDLGQASRRDKPRPLDDAPLPGDPSYAPPEQWYEDAIPDWTRRRFGCDAYHLGSLLLFFFSGVSMTHAIGERLRPEHRPIPGGWDGGYELVMPFVVEAWDEVLDAAHEQIVEDLPTVGPEVVSMVRQLTHPHPERRGHPKMLGRADPYSLDRYVAQLDLLARQAEIEGL